MRIRRIRRSSFLIAALLVGAWTSRMPGVTPPLPAFEDEEVWAGQIQLQASSHLFRIETRTTRAGRRPSLVLAAAPDLPPMPLTSTRTGEASVSFEVAWVEAEYRFKGRKEGARMSGTVEARVPNRLLGVSLGDRIIVRGTWEAALLRTDPTPISLPPQGRPSGIAFTEWMDRIEPGKGRIGIQHVYAEDGRYILRDATTGEPREGFDGRRYWRIRPDGWSEFVAPPESDRLWLLAALRSGRFPAIALEGRDPFDGLLAGIVSAPGGRSCARVWLDPADGTLHRAVIEDEQGLIRLAFEDHRSWEGRTVPSAWSIAQNERQASGRLTEPVRPNFDPAAFALNPRRPVAQFANDRPAEVDVALGRGRKGHHFVQPQIDGWAGWFLLDSGASDLVIDRAAADRMALPIIAELEPGVTLRQAKTLRLGRLLLLDPVFVARDLDGLTGPEGRERAGILGFPLFQSVVVEVDYPRDRIALHDPAEYRLPRGEAWTPLTVEVRPSIEAEIEGMGTGRFVVDTGKSARISFRSDFAARHEVLAGRDVSLTPTETYYGDTFEFRTRIEAVRFAGYRFRDAHAHVKIPGTYNSAGSHDGIIGRGFLEPFIVVFDYSGERIALIQRAGQARAAK